MTEIKEFSKNWFKKIVADAESVSEQNPALTLTLLLGDLKNYITHLDEIDSRRGAPGKSSRKRAKASRANGKLGGRPKGSTNKTKQGEE